MGLQFLVPALNVIAISLISTRKVLLKKKQIGVSEGVVIDVHMWCLDNQIVAPTWLLLLRKLTPD